ncbi:MULTISPECIES: hypothetical protein [Burkholderia]|uniref:XRE family transcriptional regulator n=1 Tax=Burkholderia contaminans TaxID=488447 RepID=A0A2S5DR07_9BURK|nr:MULTISPECIES: hypothetical protein [Burkholderia]EKS9800310.1 hypothetical protein [Burkholderia cepacia]EKS9807911.1 hypothetical protein [Burkholderia cepacia]EKS9815511.1 hypothetical protein [Burkholderia cepacia]EKS9823024.1 hypothetical protein [Burkholderia cepacia]EKS9830614.1 hypothetical protein [Burkholderia cepacia]
MTRVEPARAVDWFRVLEDVRRADFTLAEIAQYTQIPRTTLLGYRNLGAEPKHYAGVTLLKLWAQVTGNAPDDAPTVQRMPSVSESLR